MPSKFRNLLVLGIVSAALLAFAFMSAKAIGSTLKQNKLLKEKKKVDPTIKEAIGPPAINESFTYVAGILIGLIGGIVAVGFGQSPAPRPQRKVSSTFRKNMISLGGFIIENKPTEASIRALDQGYSSPVSAKTKENFGVFYASVYVIVGIATIATWVYAPEVSPNIIKNLATVSLGLFVSIITTFFK